MIDNFGLAVSHGLIIIALWRLLRRPDLDDAAPTASASHSSAAKDREGA
jgi:hypothetical protein